VVEADADIAETIDFLEFYGREMLRLAAAETEPKCAVSAIPCVYSTRRRRRHSPWNFPCAIMAGITVASLVTGIP